MDSQTNQTKTQEEIGLAIIEAVRTAPEGITQAKFKALVLFILWRDNIQGKEEVNYVIREKL
jgi:hypothetical protein